MGGGRRERERERKKYHEYMCVFVRMFVRVCVRERECVCDIRVEYLMRDVTRFICDMAQTWVP